MDGLKKLLESYINKEYTTVHNAAAGRWEHHCTTNISKLAQAIRERMKLDDKLLCQILAGWCLGTICNQKKCCNARRLKSLKLALDSQIKELIKW